MNVGNIYIRDLAQFFLHHVENNKSYSFFEDIISWQDLRSVASLLFHNNAINIGQLCWIKPGRPKTAFLQNQKFEAVTQIGLKQFGISELGILGTFGMKINLDDKEKNKKLIFQVF